VSVPSFRLSTPASASLGRNRFLVSRFQLGPLFFPLLVVDIGLSFSFNDWLLFPRSSAPGSVIAILMRFLSLSGPSQRPSFPRRYPSFPPTTTSPSADFYLNASFSPPNYLLDDVGSASRSITDVGVFFSFEFALQFLCVGSLLGSGLKGAFLRDGAFASPAFCP